MSLVIGTLTEWVESLLVAFLGSAGQLTAGNLHDFLSKLSFHHVHDPFRDHAKGNNVLFFGFADDAVHSLADGLGIDIESVDFHWMCLVD